jgi:hypothetical protein
MTRIPTAQMKPISTPLTKRPPCGVCQHLEPKREPTPAVTDQPTIHGSWAYLCEFHRVTHGTGDHIGHRLVVEGEPT